MPRHPTFEQVLQHADLPQPGPAFYEARRRLWLMPLTGRDLPRRQAPSLAHRKLADMLNQSNAIHSIEVWSNGVERVWQGLCSGGKLKSHLPMNLIIKIIHASWLQDGTWPAGMEPPSSDDQAEQQVSAAGRPNQMPSISSADIVESTTTSPWMVAKQYRSNRWR